MTGSAATEFRPRKAPSPALPGIRSTCWFGIMSKRDWPTVHARHSCLRLAILFLQEFGHHIMHPLFICGLLGCFMLCDCARDPVPATSKQQAEERQTIGGRISVGGCTQGDAAESNSHATPSGNGLRACFENASDSTITLLYKEPGYYRWAGCKRLQLIIRPT